jgi:glycosyltransferase involved in cell wall biosynthesis
MRTQAKVSVIIPTYNRAHYICEALDSALAQTYQNVEIVVVDDGSTDGTRAVLKGYGDKIRYYYQENQGLSAALNFGIEKSSGQYLAFLGDDDIWLPGKLEVQVALLETHPEIGMVHADIIILDEGPKDSRFRRRKLPRPMPSGYILPELIIKNVIACPTVVVRRSCLDEVGFFDLDNKLSQDYDLWLRIARRFPITYLDRPLAIYRWHLNNLSQTRVNQMQDHLNAIRKVLHNTPGVVDGADRDVVHFAIDFKTAYMCFDKGSYREARRYFTKALRLRPFHWPSYGYYFACWLPPTWIKELRQLKRSYANRRNRSLEVTTKALLPV